ncbi:MAG: hypothetical protein JSU94_15695 [Phycisphaerales bacterium]|nr:MAG: hypothetical protein JSU94_15695 [Phycisphaerales bacterium]
MKDKAIVLSTAAFLLISVPAWAAIPGDFEPDGNVDFNDFAVFAGAWLTAPDDPGWNSASFGGGLSGCDGVIRRNVISHNRW